MKGAGSSEPEDAELANWLDASPSEKEIKRDYSKYESDLPGK